MNIKKRNLLMHFFSKNESNILKIHYHHTFSTDVVRIAMFCLNFIPHFTF